MQRTSTMIDISDKNKKPKSIKSKFSKFIKKTFTKKTAPSTPENDEEKRTTASVPTQRKHNDFDVEKWRKNLAKTCHDFDQMNATTYSLKSRHSKAILNRETNLIHSLKFRLWQR